MNAGKRFVAQTAGLGVGLALVGYLPTVRLAGRDAVGGMAAGIAVSLIGSWAGALPVALSRAKGPSGAGSLVLAGMLVRFVVVLGLALSIALSGQVDRAPFLIWVGLAYLILLVADTHYALRVGSTRVGPDRS